MRRTPQYLSFTEKTKVVEHLKHILAPHPHAEGYFYYPGGETDELVAEQIKSFIPRVTRNHIRDLRKECFGELAKLSRDPKVLAEREIEALRQQLGELQERVLKLEAAAKVVRIS